MTETTVGREPVQIVELNLPQCANEYGCGLCTAGLGDVDATSGLSENFRITRKDYTYSVTDGSLTIWPSASMALRFRGNAANPRMMKTGATGFDGDAYRYIVVHGKCVTPGTPLFEVSYGAFDADKTMKALNFSQRYRGATLEAIKAGKDFVAVFDAADSADYATDWQGQTVTDLQIALADGDDMEYYLYSIQICSENLFETKGGECFKTYSTCQDLDNYKGLPTDGLTPDKVYYSGDVIPYSDIDRTTTPVMFEAKVRIPMEPDGVVFQIGSSANISANFTDVYPYVDGYTLAISIGGGALADKIQGYFDVNEYLGSTITFSIYLDPLSQTAYINAYDETTGFDDYLSAATPEPPYGILTNPWADDVDGIVGSTFNGTVEYLHYYEGTHVSVFPDQSYTQKMHIGRPQQAAPRDDMRILPMLGNANTVAANINIGTFDRNFSPLGSRASSTVSFNDAVGTDRGIDPYYADRNYDVTDGSRGLFWERFRPRQKVGLYGSTVNIYDGYAGQYLSEMMTRSYLADEVTWSNGDVMSLRSRDVLTRADLASAQYPAVSVGQLSGDINDIVLSMNTTGHILSDYPASGTVRIGDELITYSAIVDNLDNTFTWTLTARGTDGSTAESHSDEDTVQKCERFTDATIYECLERIFGDGTEIPYQYMDLAGWETVSTGDLPTYGLSRVISVPSSPSVLAGELARDCGFYIWWDERVSLIKIKAIKSEATAPTALSDEDDIIAGSVSYKEKPTERMSALYIGYNPHDQTDLGTSDTTDDLTKYKNVYLTIVNEGYKEQLTKVIYSPWLTATADVFQTQSRLTRLYSEIPVQITFQLDAKDRNLWLGDVVQITNNKIRDQFGVPEARLYVITSANEVSSGEIVKYTAQDTTIFGQTYVIAPDGHGDYTGDAGIDKNYAFISLPGGLMPDGKPGATIS